MAVIFVAGLVQVFFALLRLGKFGDFFPSAAVHGMLAAIGIIIIAKQVHPMFGVDATVKEPFPLLLRIPETIINCNPEIALIGLVSLGIAIIVPRYFGGIARYLPAPLLAVVVAIGLGQFFDLEHEHHYFLFNHDYTLSEKYLVDVPANFLAGITFPDFSQITSLVSIEYILMFALIGSLESLLTVKAVDMLDPYRRKSDLNKDLMVVGFANSICGLLGGLPMISEVVRSYANVSNGAKTRWANFFHGGFLLIFIILAPQLIHKIPITALAAILCVVGYRLASPLHFIEAKHVGYDQLIVFCVTVIGTLATDLLLGVALGIITEYILCVALGAPLKETFKSKVKVSTTPGESIISLPTVCFFGTILSFTAAMRKAKSAVVVLDFTSSKLIDHSFMKHIDNVRDEILRENRLVVINGIDRFVPISNHEHGLRRFR